LLSLAFKIEAATTDVFHAGPLTISADAGYRSPPGLINSRTLHSALGRLAPAECEEDYYAAFIQGPQSV
jgi:hypothetical protein